MKSLILWFSMAGASLAAEKIASEPLPEWSAHFDQKKGWTGADGAYSVQLSADTTAWLYSDTWVGEIENNRHVRSKLINNSISLQKGFRAESARVEFYYPTNQDGTPRSVVTPEDNHGWFWLFHGLTNSTGLHMFLMQYEKAGQGGGAFGFKQIGCSLGSIENPVDHPSKWNWKQTKVPWARFDKDDFLVFGSAIMVHDHVAYIYGGSRRNVPGKPVLDGMVLARVAENDLARFDRWEFRSKEGWSRNIDDVQSIASRTASEHSVSWLPGIKKFVYVGMAGMSGEVEVRTADHPEGPWSAPQNVYSCPEKTWDRGYFCYSAKAHPELAQNDRELIITYASNAFQFSKLVNDARIYWPRFVRLRFEGSSEQK